MKVKKAVIPAAGLGIRFLPTSRSVPKEMLPVFDRPMIYYAVEQAAQAGIEHVVIVISTGKEAIANYFDIQPELERVLKEKGKLELLEEIRSISSMMEISYIYQKKQLGLGHAVLTAKNVVGNEPFAVFLPDEVSWDPNPTVAQLIDIFQKRQGSVLGVTEVPKSAIPALGIIRPRQLEERLYEVMGMVEKPTIEDAPSNLAITGPYVLSPEIFDCLKQIRPGALGEIQLTDGIALLMQRQKVYAYPVTGTRIDAGNPLGLLKASIYEALQRDDVASELREWLKGLQLE